VHCCCLRGNDDFLLLAFGSFQPIFRTAHPKMSTISATSTAASSASPAPTDSHVTAASVKPLEKNVGHEASSAADDNQRTVHVVTAADAPEDGKRESKQKSGNIIIAFLDASASGQKVWSAKQTGMRSVLTVVAGL
jgi:hypothetical protein